METDFAGLTLNEEEETILRVQNDPNLEKEEEIHDAPAGFFSEVLAKQLGDFLGKFLEYDGADLGKGFRNFLR
ncbi:hypothetical protein Golax_010569, partial [Gossypium laxum]|nr:hypothetical protein [Gossypium laxum]